jgi:hypothetical protein
VGVVENDPRMMVPRYVGGLPLSNDWTRCVRAITVANGPADIRAVVAEGWRLLADRYDDAGLSGASLERPAMQVLLGDIRERKTDVVVVYKVDRLTPSSCARLRSFLLRAVNA